MKKDEIIKAPIEEVADTWVEFYNRAQSLFPYVYTYCGDIFDSSDIKDFNESIKKLHKAGAIVYIIYLVLCYFRKEDIKWKILN